MCQCILIPLDTCSRMCSEIHSVLMTSILMPFMFASFRFQENRAIIPNGEKFKDFSLNIKVHSVSWVGEPSKPKPYKNKGHKDMYSICLSQQRLTEKQNFGFYMYN